MLPAAAAAAAVTLLLLPRPLLLHELADTAGPTGTHGACWSLLTWQAPHWRHGPHADLLLLPLLLPLQLLEPADAAGPTGMALMLTWLRLSSMRQLDWYRKSNYQSKVGRAFEGFLSKFPEPEPQAGVA